MMLSMAFSDVKKFFLILLKGMGAVVVLGVALLILWRVPQWQVGHLGADPYQRAKLEDEYRRTLVQSIGGFFLVVGLYVAWRRVKATEENVRVTQENVRVAQENVRVAQENVRVAEEGHITERFTRAIDQLGQKGDDKMAIRLGGIYALERIAKDSKKDHGPVMEVLTAYVREKVPTPEEDTPEEAKTLPTDIQAILTVISRRETTGNDGHNDSLDLTYTRLVGANLSGANLSGVNLSGVNLCWADLAGADLSGADLYGANLYGARLLRTRLSGADLTGARLFRTRLYGADLSGAVLYEAVLYEADLSGANLRRTNLRRAHLSGADLREAENLTADQVKPAEDWRDALLPASLQYLLTEPLA